MPEWENGKMGPRQCLRKRTASRPATTEVTDDYAEEMQKRGEDGFPNGNETAAWISNLSLLISVSQTTPDAPRKDTSRNQAYSKQRTVL
ncbi:uncharacterized protein N7443_001903 [Penicillium atrosanguineum]|uniref:Uncharacterized protein n=1 Tax=Penicillium atrosanguineum TaxID=1132637 RepID=A0A9W9U3F0_9EURO|nr:uncharacterized protein N7443_001903 [Penicillium atrosanguineum]KAJ5309442.1 hypothetical protein N7443_001903 [Penicillium atrosanguineum]KAJ5314961.1 hypothetical protein N7476_005268 [Penicillium atrosanguineum]